MNQQQPNEQDPSWRWLWERLLLPLSDKKDAGIVQPNHLNLAKDETDSKEQ
jgi:hypothetical protein